MLLTIHDAQLRKVAFVDNEKQGTLDFFDDTWTRNLQTGSSTYEFSISKKSLVSDTVFNRTYNYLNERAFVSFEYKGETFLFNVMTVEEDEKKIKCYCENLNLELINEYSNPFKADRAMSFVEYCNAMDLLNMTKLSVGINEVSDYKRTLEWEGQDTKLARLISLANKFDAEIEFKTYLNDDSTIKQFLVNVYHENDGVNYHGVGRDRKDITLVYGKNIKSIRRKIDKTNIFNMIVPTAQSEENSDQKLTIGSLPNWELKNDKGIVEFYKRGDAIYAPISAQLYPSTFTPETQSDQWIRRDMDFNVKSIQQLETEGLKRLKASAYPELTYEFDGYIDADIGDTVELSDSGFANTLLIEARIFEQKLSFSTRKNWKTTLGNFRALQSKLSSDIQSELERLVENAKPYNIRISTDNGTMFKNNEGESLVKATLWKGGKVVNQDVSWRWALDGVVTVGMQYLVKAKDIDEIAVLTVAGYVGNTEVATTEITLANLLERAETRRETFYKLTNSADVPTAPSEGGRNLYALSKEIGRLVAKGGATNLALDVANGTLSFDVNGAHPYFGECVWAGIDYLRKYGQLIPVKANSAIAVSFSSADFNENYVSFVTNNKCAKPPKVFRTQKVIVDASELDGVEYIVVRGGVNNGDGSLTGETVTTKIKVEYGNVATPYSQAPEDLGWSANTLVPTQSQRYLWKFEYVYYSDGSVEITQPTNISIAGADGTNGQTSHVHFAFADNATGGGFSLTTPKAYMGWYADFNETASNDPTKYKWGKWKGDQGVRGDKGDDGKTSYLHLAYASSADGKTGFSFTESGQQYQGYYTDFVQTSSTDPTKYTWMDRRAGIEVGGVNLLHNSQGPFKPNKDNPYKHDNCIVYPKVTAYLEEGKQYIVTAKTDGAFSNNHVNVESDNIILWMVKANGSVNQIISDTKTGEAGTVFIWNHPTGEYCLRVNAYHDEPDKSAWEVKIEEGNVKTTYTRNPEDVQSDIDSKADQALTQQQLNALAEKNRNMEAEMAAKASLAEVERWKQAYDEYVAQNDADKTSAEQKLITLTSRVAEWVKDWEDKKVQWSFLDTNMDFGEEGLRLGKKGSPTSILISNDRIGFYSGGSEVASMSNGTLTIDNGIFAKSLQIGHYREEVYEGDKTINVIRWID